MSSPRPAIALVTGASSGIGRELAALFAADGRDVMLVARRVKALLALESELEGEHGVEAHVFPADLAEEDAADRIAENVEQRGVEVRWLVNNAGFGLYGPFASADARQTRRMLDVNVGALTDLTQRFVGPMVANGEGRILNVASTGAFQPVPFMAAYTATKAYVLHYTVALGVELEGSGVTATALCPGPTRTEFADEAGAESTRMFIEGRGMDAAEVARLGYRGMEEGKPIVVTGPANRLGAFAPRLVSRVMAARIARGLTSRVD